MNYSPCYICTKHSEICHVHCKVYADWLAEQKAKKEKIRKAKQRESEVNEFVCAQGKRIRRKQQSEWDKRHQDRGGK